MRRSYYIRYYRDFSNTYSLLYAETPEQMEVIKDLDHVHQISREEAEKRARENRRYSDKFAAHDIIPADLYSEDSDHPANLGYRLNGVIWEK